MWYGYAGRLPLPADDELMRFARRASHEALSVDDLVTLDTLRQGVEHRDGPTGLRFGHAHTLRSSPSGKQLGIANRTATRLPNRDQESERSEEPQTPLEVPRCTPLASLGVNSTSSLAVARDKL
jgi:hypothetical protein